MTAPLPPVGITTTIPIEILLAAGRQALDLNNVFVADAHASEMIARAERSGFPRSGCAWVKGIYGAIHARGVREVVGVVEGDCSDTGALLEVLESEGIAVHAFAFPHTRERGDLERELTRFAGSFGVELDEAEAMKQTLDPVRALAGELDTLAADGAVLSSRELFESLLWLSDFTEGVEACRRRLEDRLAIARNTAPAFDGLRLGCVGVPTILSNLWETFEAEGGRFVYHEVPRQFALIPSVGIPLVDSYLKYTYPYRMADRLGEIEREVARRRLDGLVHYVQSFCHRQIQDRLLRQRLNVPILTIEGDRPGAVDGRTRTRIEAFLEQLRG